MTSGTIQGSRTAAHRVRLMLGLSHWTMLAGSFIGAAAIAVVGASSAHSSSATAVKAPAPVTSQDASAAKLIPPPKPPAVGPGFLSSSVTIFAPVLAFAPAGPNRAARAVKALDTAIPFFRKLFFRPELDSGLQQVVDKMPPRQSTLIRAAALYGDSSIPWRRLDGGLHEIAVTGVPQDANFLYSLAPSFSPPADDFAFSGIFSLFPNSLPKSKSAAGYSTSVIGRLGGAVALDSFGAAALVDAAAMAVQETYGDLEAPWDRVVDEYNHHDGVALQRIESQAPHFSARMREYFALRNLLDEFSSAQGPFVLVNVDASVRTEALKRFPHLYTFYTHFGPHVLIDSRLLDAHGNQWFQALFDHGRIRIIYAIRDGMLVALDRQWKPVGEPVALNLLRSGNYRAVTSIALDRMKMRFGLADIAFTVNYWRSGERMDLDSRMDTVPQLVAPAMVSPVVRLIAGDFLTALARGNGGMVMRLDSGLGDNKVYRTSLDMTGELRYSPSLSVLARIGDAIAAAHNVEVRDDERKLGEELFDALVEDYGNARPEILELDSKRTLSASN